MSIVPDHSTHYAGPYQPAPQPPKGSGLAVTSLVLGIIGLLLAFVPFLGFLGIVLGLIGLPFGIIGWVGAGKGKRAGKGMAIAGSVLALVTIVGGSVAQATYVAAVDAAVNELDRSFGGATEEVLANDLKVELGAFTATEEEFGIMETALPVTLTNTSDERLSYNITVEALDADGARIETDILFANELAPGQSVEEDMFIFVTEKDAKKLDAATFSVTEASAY